MIMGYGSRELEPFEDVCTRDLPTNLVKGSERKTVYTHVVVAPVSTASIIQALLRPPFLPTSYSPTELICVPCLYMVLSWRVDERVEMLDSILEGPSLDCIKVSTGVCFLRFLRHWHRSALIIKPLPW